MNCGKRKDRYGLSEPGTAGLSGLIVITLGVGVGALSASLLAAVLTAVWIGTALTAVLSAQP